MNEQPKFRWNIQNVGDLVITVQETFKAYAMFTPFSSIFHCAGERYHARVNRARIFCGALLVRLHPRIGIKFALSIAALAEGEGQEAVFRRMILNALKQARRLENALHQHPRNLTQIVQCYVRLADFHAAKRAITACLSHPSTGATQLLSAIEEIEEECASWRHVIDASRAALEARLAGKSITTDTNEIDLYLPSNAFGVEPLGYDGFQKDLRRAFSKVIAILEEAGVKYQPQLRIATHGNFGGRRGPFISYHSVSKDSNGLHIKESDRRSFFSADPWGYSGWSEFSTRAPGTSLNVHDFSIKAFIATERNLLISANLSKYEQPDKQDLSFDRPYVFVALQILDDAVQRLSHMHMFDMLEEVSNTCELLGIEVVVKRHPKCASPAVGIALKRGVKCGKFILSHASIHDLIHGSIAVCTVNSSVGAEALLHGKPVYCFGAAEYQQACFQIKNRGDFQRQFKPSALPHPIEHIERILYELRHDYSVNVRDETTLGDEFWRKKLSGLY